MENKIVTKIIGFAYLSIIFIFPTTDVLDIDTWRLLSFSVLNTFALGYIFINTELSRILFHFIKTKSSIVILSFILWCFISYFYAINGIEVILRSFYFVNFYFIFLVLYTILKFNNFNFYFISIVLMINVAVQASYSFYALMEITRFSDYNFGFNNLLMGFFPNRNITQAVYLYQLPFVIYVLSYSKSSLMKIISGIISTLLVFIIFMMGARTSYVILLTLMLASISIILMIKDINLKIYLKNFILITFLGFIISTVSLSPNNSAFISKRISTIDFEETSTATRIRYYKHGINHLIDNPFIGVGFGNWKIESINYDKENIVSYIIPYTLHNDFLEVATELGLIGLIMFILIFFYPFKDLWNFFNRNKSEPISLVLTFSLLVYFIDSNINFPFTRISQLFYLALILILISYYIKNKKDEVSS